MEVEAKKVVMSVILKLSGDEAKGFANFLEATEQKDLASRNGDVKHGGFNISLTLRNLRDAMGE